MGNKMLLKIDAWLTSVFGITLSYLLTTITDIMPQINAFLISCISLAFFYWRYREAKARALQEEAKYEETRKTRKNSKASKV
jgi:L-lactate permease